MEEGLARWDTSLMHLSGDRIGQLKIVDTDVEDDICPMTVVNV